MVSDFSKVCNKCGVEKPLTDFYKHKTARLGVDNRCKVCAIAASKVYQQENPERVREKNLRWNAENSHRASANKRRWNSENREKRAAKQAAWNAANPEKVKRSKQRYREVNADRLRAYEKVRRDTPKMRLEAAVSSGVRRGITRGSKYGRRTFDLLGYTSEQLIAHIESQFEPGMSWQNYAHDTWHIDHIRPLASFNYQTPDDPDFKEAWALSNLRPLWAFDNMSKGAKWDGPLPANDNEPLTAHQSSPRSEP